ncbi:tRNAHis guanylyltransferase-domain-containing protein [Polychytrium aggregatum]|uniref:tRNAHis guanylyltransferase-domain-containing protein n=1 Tax=Polychytrium aggregatum TaxID=110093 RepID=UPI0022FE1F3A|nr:tRNAHis guanylyltransferase-domain-containing protein [Polychytrium aggregatum]KAI9204162.1 tRNAHis guanylyltransferase-domain-containing protein [Polychytrium aggregatum]
MACSKFEYVKAYERNDALLPNTWLVVRIDGHSFHRFTQFHKFAKPNDDRALKLANHCAKKVMEEFHDIVLAYGQSDEFSFCFSRYCQLYKRRESKIVTNVVSLFTSNYVMAWKEFFPDLELQYAPSFDGRAVLYPTDQNIRDYFSWRQADCHINNLYNTVFWCMVLDPNSPKTERETQAILKDTDSGAKNEILFQQYGINYNNLPELYRKGSVLHRKQIQSIEASATDGSPVVRRRKVVVIEHCDIIGDAFWTENQILGGSA